MAAAARGARRERSRARFDAAPVSLAAPRSPLHATGSDAPRARCAAPTARRPARGATLRGGRSAGARALHTAQHPPRRRCAPRGGDARGRSAPRSFFSSTPRPPPAGSGSRPGGGVRARKARRDASRIRRSTRRARGACTPVVHRCFNSAQRARPGVGALDCPSSISMPIASLAPSPRLRGASSHDLGVAPLLYMRTRYSTAGARASPAPRIAIICVRRTSATTARLPSGTRLAGIRRADAERESFSARARRLSRSPRLAPPSARLPRRAGVHRLRALRRALRARARARGLRRRTQHAPPRRRGARLDGAAARRSARGGRLRTPRARRPARAGPPRPQHRDRRDLLRGRRPCPSAAASVAQRRRVAPVRSAATSARESAQVERESLRERRLARPRPRCRRADSRGGARSGKKAGAPSSSVGRSAPIIASSAAVPVVARARRRAPRATPSSAGRAPARRRALDRHPAARRAAARAQIALAPGARASSRSHFVPRRRRARQPRTHTHSRATSRDFWAISTVQHTTHTRRERLRDTQSPVMARFGHTSRGRSSGRRELAPARGLDCDLLPWRPRGVSLASKRLLAMSSSSKEALAAEEARHRPPRSHRRRAGGRRRASGAGATAAGTRRCRRCSTPVPRHVHELERGRRRSCDSLSTRHRARSSPRRRGALALAPSAALSLVAEQRYNDEFDDEEREPDEDEYVFSVKYQRENGDASLICRTTHPSASPRRRGSSSAHGGRTWRTSARCGRHPRPATPRARTSRRRRAASAARRRASRRRRGSTAARHVEAVVAA